MKLKPSDYGYNKERNVTKTMFNSIIKNKEEKKYYSENGCPKCRSLQIWYRTMTKDYKCRICKSIFIYSSNKQKYLIKQRVICYGIRNKITQNPLRIIASFHKKSPSQIYTVYFLTEDMSKGCLWVVEDRKKAEDLFEIFIRWWETEPDKPSQQLLESLTGLLSRADYEIYEWNTFIYKEK